MPPEASPTISGERGRRLEFLLVITSVVPGHVSRKYIMYLAFFGRLTHKRDCVSLAIATVITIPLNGFFPKFPQQQKQPDD
jgi:hypothetical protein